jgi:hypothetical protein
MDDGFVAFLLRLRERRGKTERGRGGAGGRNFAKPTPSEAGIWMHGELLNY